MRREMGVQGDLVVKWAEMPRSPGYAFLFVIQSDVALAVAIMAEIDGKTATFTVIVTPESD